MHFFCWITKATDRDAEYAVLFSLPMQQWLGERASMLHLYVGYITSLVKTVYDEMQVYGVSLEECARLRESVPYVKLYRYNPKHLCPK